MYENLFILLLVIVLVCITTRKITEHFQQISNATTFNITANKLSTFNEDKLCVGDTCMKETDIQAIHKHLEKKKKYKKNFPKDHVIQMKLLMEREQHIEDVRQKPEVVKHVRNGQIAFLIHIQELQVIFLILV